MIARRDPDDAPRPESERSSTQRDSFTAFGRRASWSGAAWDRLELIVRDDLARPAAHLKADLMCARAPGSGGTLGGTSDG